MVQSTYTAFIDLHGMQKKTVVMVEKITKKTAELDRAMTDLANQANRTGIAIDGVPEMKVFLKLVDFSATLYVHPSLNIDNYLSDHPILHQDKHLAMEAGMDGYIALDHNVFVRDFVPCALALLMNGEPKQVEKFFKDTLQLQEKKLDRFQLGEVVMPDFGEIGKVAPIDSGFWWIILLRAYTKSTGDTSLADKPECQKFIGLILSLFPFNKFDTFPNLLSADGRSINDHRMMGVSPIEIQALFFMALRCAMLLLKHDGPGKELIEQMRKHLHAWSCNMRNYFWLDLKQLNDIYKTEEYSHTAVNKFNVMPDSLPDWVKKFVRPRGGYFIGNIGPSHMDFRWYCLGNCMAILSSLATHEQSSAIMDLIESRWEELVGDMPLKVCYPAIENHEWRIATGYDTKNTRWSYDNGPVLLWLLTAACIKMGRLQIARRAIELAETRLAEAGWLELYDKSGRYVGKKPRKHKMWSVAGFMVSRMLLRDPSHLGMVAIEED